MLSRITNTKLIDAVDIRSGPATSLEYMVSISKNNSLSADDPSIHLKGAFTDREMCVNLWVRLTYASTSSECQMGK